MKTQLALLIALGFAAQGFAGGVATGYTDIDVSGPTVRHHSDGKECVPPRQSQRQVIVVPQEQDEYEPEIRTRLIVEHHIDWGQVTDIIGLFASIERDYQHGRCSRGYYLQQRDLYRYHCQQRRIRIIEPRCRIIEQPRCVRYIRSSRSSYPDSGMGINGIGFLRYGGALQRGAWQRSSHHR